MVDLEVSADDAGWAGANRYLGISNEYMANLKDGVLIANKNANVTPSQVYGSYEEIANYNIASTAVCANYTTNNVVGFITDQAGIACAFGNPELRSVW